VQELRLVYGVGVVEEETSMEPVSEPTMPNQSQKENSLEKRRRGLNKMQQLNRSAPRRRHFLERLFK
jgi:hypothetical protein